MRYTRLYEIDYQYKTAYYESNSDVTDDVTWPQKVNVMTPISSKLSISTTVRDNRSVQIDHFNDLKCSSSMTKYFLYSDNSKNINFYHD